MSTDADRFGKRLAAVEVSIEQMNERLRNYRKPDGPHDGRVDTVEQRIDRVDDRIDETRQDIWNWLVFVVLATSAILTLVVSVFQFVLAG